MRLALLLLLLCGRGSCHSRLQHLNLVVAAGAGGIAVRVGGSARLGSGTCGAAQDVSRKKGLVGIGCATFQWGDR